MVNTRVDIAVDLMHDIREVDASQDPVLIARRNRVTAAVMREVGFSDHEIVAKLGYFPEPFGGEVLSDDAEPTTPVVAPR